jgi:starvation-inducible DNA-binding protein
MSLIISLKKVLADNYLLLLKTQNYHWNVKGAHFYSLHLLFQEQYTDLFNAVDEIAEYIRASGEIAPGTWKAYSAVSKITDGIETLSAMDMVADLAKSQTIIMESLQECIDSAEEVNDTVIADAMIARVAIHRKNKWKLDSLMA